MPELPEVETTRRGIAPHLLGRRVQQVLVRQPRLRWPVPADLDGVLSGQIFVSAERRAKYLLFGIGSGHLLWHLGMSGSLRIVPAATPVRKHDHIDIVLDNGNCLRFTDPRRFGALLWTVEAPATHHLLRHLGPEPLSLAFNGEYLYQRSRGRKTAVKSFLMDGRIVVGVGNIYANESLFLAGINPLRDAGRISLLRYNELVAAVRGVLEAAIRQGGTTLRDYVGGSGEPGYFRQQLRVYERAGLPCLNCAEPVRVCRLGQRSTYYCACCQH